MAAHCGGAAGARTAQRLDIYSHAFDKNKKLAQEKLAEAMGL